MHQLLPGVKSSSFAFRNVLCHVFPAGLLENSQGRSFERASKYELMTSKRTRRVHLGVQFSDLSEQWIVCHEAFFGGTFFSFSFVHYIVFASNLETAAFVCLHDPASVSRIFPNYPENQTLFEWHSRQYNTNEFAEELIKIKIKSLEKVGKNLVVVALSCCVVAVVPPYYYH